MHQLYGEARLRARHQFYRVLCNDSYLRSWKWCTNLLVFKRSSLRFRVHALHMYAHKLMMWWYSLVPGLSPGNSLWWSGNQTSDDILLPRTAGRQKHIAEPVIFFNTRALEQWLLKCVNKINCIYRLKWSVSARKQSTKLGIGILLISNLLQVSIHV